MMKTSHSGNILQVNGREITLAYPIKESFALGDMVVVLLDPDSNLGSHGQFKNVMAFDERGGQIWVAELPTDKPSDVYYQVVSRTPLKLSSFCSYECLLDSGTGKILTRSFYK